MQNVIKHKSILRNTVLSFLLAKYHPANKLSYWKLVIPEFPILILIKPPTKIFVW